MADLELLISRYLDGELTPAEHLRMQKLLAESPEARALLREMSVLGRAARRSPLLHQPPSHVESALFARLREEGLHHPAVPETAAPMAQSAPGRWYGARLVRTALAGVALLTAFIGDSYFVNRGAIPITPAASASSPAYASRIEIGRGEYVAPPLLRIPASPRVATPHSVRHAASEDEPAPTIAMAISPRKDSVAPPAIVSPEESHRSIARTLPEPGRDTFSIPVDPLPTDADAPETGGRLAASLRPGVAMIERRERAIARELNFQIGMELKGGHQISLIFGSAPALTETRNLNTFEPLSSPALAATPDEGVRSEADLAERGPALPLPEYELRLRNEPWAGVGYSYSVSPLKGMSVGVGINAGASASAWRVGGELPVRYAVMQNVSIEGALSLSSFTPRNHDVEHSVVTDSPDHFLYRTSVERPSFVSYGMQLGIRIDLAGNH